MKRSSIAGLGLLLASIAACDGVKDGGDTQSPVTECPCLPQCYLDMFADCMPEGTCAQEATGSTVDACYENGVTLSTTIGSTGASLVYYKADGSVCFTAESLFSSTSVTATYRDPNGNVLLTDTSPISNGAVQTITCNGQTYMVDTNSAACKSCGSGGTATPCTTGTCTAAGGSGSGGAGGG